MNALKRISAFLALAIVLAACGGGGGGDTGAMTDVAKQFMEAALKGEKDKAAGFVCDAYKQAAEGIVTAFSQMASVPGASVEFSGLTYTPGAVAGNVGIVTVGGKLKITVAGTTQEVDLSQAGAGMAALPMKNDGGWKICTP
jgi:hypothetical protein